jgi:hypothetical protein
MPLLFDNSSFSVADSNNSVGFFNVIALPLLNAWVDVFPECHELLDQVCGKPKQQNHTRLSIILLKAPTVP